MVHTATIGSIGEFVPENETITAYLERVQLFMDANTVEEGKEVPVLLSVIGGKTYGLLHNLVAPGVVERHRRETYGLLHNLVALDQPKSKKLDELMSVLVLGELLVKVSYERQTHKLPLIIVQGKGPALLGRKLAGESQAELENDYLHCQRNSTEDTTAGGTRTTQSSL